MKPKAQSINSSETPIELSSLPIQARRLLGRVPDELLASLAKKSIGDIVAARKALNIPTAAKRKQATAEAFVIVWQRSESVEAVAIALGMELTACSQRAASYRRRGVPLKLMHPGRFVDWEAVTALAQSALAEDQADGK